MLDFDAIAEERIQEALRRGDFDRLPGMGRPLDLDDDSLIAPEMRTACRILKNAGLVPAEVLERKEIARLEALLPAVEDVAERCRALQKLALLRTRLGDCGGVRLPARSGYSKKIIERFTGTTATPRAR
jgi:hypothetical protein